MPCATTILSRARIQPLKSNLRRHPGDSPLRTFHPEESTRMPPSKKSPPARNSDAIAPKPKKKHAPPPPHEDESHRKPGKKHAKKHPKKHDEKPNGKHLRRAYEHLGRVEALQALTTVDSVVSLVRLAQAGIAHGQARVAADLLRSAEHLSFAAATATSKSKPSLSSDLEEAIRREFRKLLEAAEEHDLSSDSTLGKLLRRTFEDAHSAFDSGNFRQALELARAAEALGSIETRDVDKLDKPMGERALKA